VTTVRITADQSTSLKEFHDRIPRVDCPRLFIRVAIGVSRGAKEPRSHKISGISCHFVLWETMSQTKYCCSLEVKRFSPKNFGLATPLRVAPHKTNKQKD